MSYTDNLSNDKDIYLKVIVKASAIVRFTVSKKYALLILDSLA